MHAVHKLSIGYFKMKPSIQSRNQTYFLNSPEVESKSEHDIMDTDDQIYKNLSDHALFLFYC